MAEFDLNNYTFSQLTEIRDNYGDCDEDAIAELIDQKGEMLEKQLKDTRAEIEHKDKLIEQMREALKLALLYVPDNATDAIRISEAALSAAERGE